MWCVRPWKPAELPPPLPVVAAVVLVLATVVPVVATVALPASARSALAQLILLAGTRSPRRLRATLALCEPPLPATDAAYAALGRSLRGVGAAADSTASPCRAQRRGREGGSGRAVTTTSDQETSTQTGCCCRALLPDRRKRSDSRPHLIHVHYICISSLSGALRKYLKAKLSTRNLWAPYNHGGTALHRERARRLRRRGSNRRRTSAVHATAPASLLSLTTGKGLRYKYGERESGGVGYRCAFADREAKRDSSSLFGCLSPDRMW